MLDHFSYESCIYLIKRLHLKIDTENLEFTKNYSQKAKKVCYHR